MLGRVVGNYRIVEKIGEGGMGAVYLAVDEMLEREVAIKAIRPDLAREPQIVERFRAEAKILARVSHPSIAGIYSFFYDGGELFLAMELVRGRTLSEVIESGGALPWQRAVPLFSTALEGIEQAHRAGIIHRDLKPDNLMLTEAGTLKVMDFGIARMAGSTHLTRTGLLMGTLRYIAPEQIRGEEVDQRTDIYALGVVFYQMLTGRVPFDGPTDFAILKAQLDDPPVPPASLVPSLPEWVDRTVLKALEKNPAARFQSVEDLRLFLGRQGPAVLKIVEDIVILPPRAHPPGKVATIPSPATVETDRTRLPAAPPSQSTTVSPPATVASTSYRPMEGAGWKRGALAAAVALVLIAAVAFLWTRRGPGEPTVEPTSVSITETPVQQPPAPAEPDAPLTAANSIPLKAAQPPRRVPHTQEPPRPVGPPPSYPPETDAAPSVSQKAPEKAKISLVITEAEPEPIPLVQAAGEEASPETLSPAKQVLYDQVLYDQGYTLYQQGRYVDAEASFQRFLQANPESELADNAQYWIGQCRYLRNDIKGALAAFREAVNRFPKGNKVADAMLTSGQCLEAMGDVEGARLTYWEVGRRFPGTAAEAAADERLARLPP